LHLKLLVAGIQVPKLLTGDVKTTTSGKDFVQGIIFTCDDMQRLITRVAHFYDVPANNRYKRKLSEIRIKCCLQCIAKLKFLKNCATFSNSLLHKPGN